MSKVKEKLYDVRLLRGTLLYAVICAKKELKPQEAVNRCVMLSGRWSFVTKTEIKKRKIEWFDPNHPESFNIYPTPCTEHPKTHVHILANC